MYSLVVGYRAVASHEGIWVRRGRKRSAYSVQPIRSDRDGGISPSPVCPLVDWWLCSEDAVGWRYAAWAKALRGRGVWGVAGRGGGSACKAGGPSGMLCYFSPPLSLRLGSYRRLSQGPF